MESDGRKRAGKECIRDDIDRFAPININSVNQTQPTVAQQHENCTARDTEKKKEVYVFVYIPLRLLT